MYTQTSIITISFPIITEVLKILKFYTLKIHAAVFSLTCGIKLICFITYLVGKWYMRDNLKDKVAKNLFNQPR